MKIVTGIVLTSAFALVSQTLGSGVRVSMLRSAFGPSTAQAAESREALAVSPRPAEARAGQAEVLDLDAASDDRFIRVGPLNRRVLIPKHLCRTDAKHDVLVHFHGVPTSVEPSVDRSGLDAVVVIVNWGIGSGPYEDYFHASRRAHELRRLDRTVGRPRLRPDHFRPSTTRAELMERGLRSSLPNPAPCRGSSAGGCGAHV